MKRCSPFAPRWWAAISTALLLCWSGGCGRRVVYVEGGRRLTPLTQGQPAPFDGVLLTPEYLSEIYELLPREADLKKP
jgi:hypothetical protein